MDGVSVLFERTRGDASSALTRGQTDLAKGLRWDAGRVVLNIDAVSRHASFGAIKYRRGERVVGVFAPIPVWLIPGIS